MQITKDQAEIIKYLSHRRWQQWY